MTTPSVPLSTLGEALARKESELLEMRRAYEDRLAELRKRKADLETQLCQVDLEIQSATQTSTPTASSPAPERKPTPPSTPAPRGKTPALSLPQLLVSILREKGCPMSVNEMAKEVERRKYPTSSSNLPKVIGTRVSELLSKGVLKYAPGQEGVIPASQMASSKAKPSGAKTNGKAEGTNSRAAATSSTAPANAGSLQTLLTTLLAKSSVPLKARQLSEQALASGYRTKSKTFVDVVWTALGQMDNVENIKGQGYRLKRRSVKSK